jgi:hypothetical protein
VWGGRDEERRELLVENVAQFGVFVRAGPSSKQLAGRALLDYVRGHFTDTGEA